MKTLEQLYNEVAASDELKAAFAEAAKDKDTAVGFLRDNGCEASFGELAGFMKDKASEGEMNDGDVEAVAGGATGKLIAMSIFTVGLGCAGVAYDSNFYYKSAQACLDAYGEKD